MIPLGRLLYCHYSHTMQNSCAIDYIVIEIIGFGYGVLHHYQQYFSYIVTVSFIGGEHRVRGENHRPVASH